MADMPFGAQVARHPAHKKGVIEKTMNKNKMHSVEAYLKSTLVLCALDDVF